MDPVIPDFSRERFERALHGTFTLRHLDGGEAFEARLVEVRLLRTTAVGEQFSALFVAAGPPRGQGTYHAANTEFGELDVFMVPVGREAAGFLYEVCVAHDSSVQIPRT